jgi:hypothetical protein
MAARAPLGKRAGAAPDPLAIPLSDDGGRHVVSVVLG